MTESNDPGAERETADWEASWDEVDQRGWQPIAEVDPLPPPRPFIPPTPPAPPAGEPASDGSS